MTIEGLTIENAALKAELSEVKQKLSWLMEQLSCNNRKLYGASSQKSIYDAGLSQISLFPSTPAVMMPAVADEPALETQEEAPPKRKPKKQGEMGSRIPEGLPIETIECTLPEDERKCGICGEPMSAIGRELVRRELKFTPARATIIETWRTAYACGNCEENAEAVPVVKAPLPPQVIRGSMCAPETVAHIIVEKCVMGSPLYRQEKSWQRDGIPITRQTMANWLIRCSEDYFEPIYTELHRLLCLQQCLHADETVFQVLREPGKPAQSQSRMWLYRTSVGAKHPIVLYDYQPDRKQERPREFLAGFSGYLLTDGYAAYHGLPGNIVVVGCFSHARAKFSDALKCLKEEERAGSLALIGKQYCDKIFDIERGIKDCSFDDRYCARQKQAVPVLDEFRAWLESVNPLVSSKSKLGMAVGYALNQWKYLIRYLLDGRIECSNNRAERSVKPFVINRKNFLFATSVAGARASAVLHSLTQTAIENGLNPFAYLTYVLRTAAAGNIREDSELLFSDIDDNFRHHW